MNQLPIRLCLALCLLLPLAHSEAAASADNTELQVFKAQTEAKMEAAKENQQKDLQLHQQLVASQNERIEQVNHQVDWLGHLLSIGSLIITLLLVVIGYFAYGKAKSDAENIAKAVAKAESNITSKDEVKKWFDENLALINNEISSLRETLKQITKEADAHAARTRREIDATNASLQEHVKQIIANNPLSTGTQTVFTESDKQVLAQASTSLQDIPESQYTFDDWNTRAYTAFTEGNFSLAAEYWKKSAHATQVTDAQMALALVNQGVALERQGNLDEAIVCYQQVVQRHNNSTQLALQEIVAYAFFNEGAALGQQNKPDEAIVCYQQLVQRFGDSNLPDLQEQVGKALVNQGVTLGHQNKPDEAVVCYQQVVQRFGDSNLPALQEQVAAALVNQGVTLGRQNKSDEAVVCYQQVVQRFGDSNLPDLQEQVGKALINQGATLGQQNKSDEAIVCYQQVVQRFGDSSLPALQEQVAKALVNQGTTLGQHNKSDEAIVCYQQVVQRFGDSSLPALQEQVAKALVNQGATLGQQNKSDEAIVCYQQVVQRFGDSSLPALQEQVAKALVNQGMTLGHQNKSDEAIVCYQQVVQRFSDSNLPALQEPVAVALNGGGFYHLVKAKLAWDNEIERNRLLTESLNWLKQAIENAHSNSLKAIALGNVSYALWLLGRTVEAEAPLQEALMLDGKVIFDAEIADTKISPVKSDIGFEQLVTRLWNEIESKELTD